MHKIYYGLYDGGVVPLALEDAISSQNNIFTVIVGKNGIGKSRLLTQIARDCINSYNASPREPFYNASPGEPFYNTSPGEPFYNTSPGEPFYNTSPRGPFYNASPRESFYSVREKTPKIIAVSTSPFDKFPSNRKGFSAAKTETNYRYVGMRGEGPFGVSNAVSLLSSAARGWLEKLAYLENPANLLDVFHSLDFQPHAEFIFKPGYLGADNSAYEKIPYHAEEILWELNKLYSEYHIAIEMRCIEHLINLSREARDDIYYAMIEISHFESGRKAVTLSVDFTNGETLVGSYAASNRFAQAILILMNAGFMRLIDMRLFKNSYGPMSLKRASSGEQCLLVMMLGIAGHITDNSTILIDEPEISLHPRWQEEFIIMITRAFSSYSGCQFIIATHSPQIISRLPDKGCYITSLTKRTIYRSREFSNRSADYQLAELFDAPGIMNEYIARLAFSLLSKVKASKSVSEKNWSELQQLKQLIENVNYNDPIQELVESVSLVCDIYAKN